MIDELAGGATLRDARAPRSPTSPARFLGRGRLRTRCYLCISGRYEFHNKGIDLLLDALAGSTGAPGGRSCCSCSCPPATPGVKRDVIERLSARRTSAAGPLGLSTHNLFDAERDPIQKRCARARPRQRARHARVKIVQVPVYLDRHDGFLDLPYEAVLRAMDLIAFPSFYEPWGYTPEESLAVGVPTVTTDCAGFGRWARAEEPRRRATASSCSSALQASDATRGERPRAA